MGQPLRRFEDRRLLIGKGCYVDDLALPGALQVAFLRSPHARARILSLDTAEAAVLPGVVAVFTGAELAEVGGLTPNALTAGLVPPPFPLLAASEVMAVGQPLAAVVAETSAAALDALEAILPDFASLDPVVTMEQSGEAEALFPGVPGNRALWQDWHQGDVEAAFARAARVARVELRHPRLLPAALEPRGAAAAWDESAGRLTVWLSSQTPHRARQDLARMLCLDPEAIRVVAPDVGGAFGMKASLYPEEVLVAWAARHLKRSLKWSGSRAEDFLAASHGRGAATTGEVALDDQGRLLGLRAGIVAPLGHWLPYSAAVPAWNAGRILPGPYDLSTVEIFSEGRLTNTAPVGIYRGAGRPEAAMLMERLMDEAARASGLDPLELRRRNLLPPERLPHRLPSGSELDSGDYPRALARLCEIADYDELRRRQTARRERGELFGIGLACYVEPCGQGWESAALELESDGRFRAATGGSSQGHGRETAFAQILAEALCCDPSEIALLHGDSASAPQGIGALASRSTAIGGSALLAAAHRLRDRARALVADRLALPSEAIVLSQAGFERADASDAAIPWAEVARLAAAVDDPLNVTLTYEVDKEAWGYGCYLATLSIDRDTGQPRVEAMFCVEDIGTVVNPLLVEGQVLGGIAQGLGEALMEQVVYDSDGQLLTGSLADYALPRASDMPVVTLETLVTPSPNNLLGAKGVGEAGCIGAPPAILNAALDALAPLGVRQLDLPLTAETLWRAMKDASDERGPQ